MVQTLGASAYIQGRCAVHVHVYWEWGNAKMREKGVRTDWSLARDNTLEGRRQSKSKM